MDKVKGNEAIKKRERKKGRSVKEEDTLETVTKKTVTRENYGKK